MKRKVVDEIDVRLRMNKCPRCKSELEVLTTGKKEILKVCKTCNIHITDPANEDQ